jgi:hypothetical protein
MAEKKEVVKETKGLTLEDKQEYFNIALAVAGVRFDQPTIVLLLVELYDKMLEKQGEIVVSEINAMKKEYIKKMAVNESQRNIPAPAKKN